MAYIGTTPTSGDFVLLDSITTSATASYTMQRNSVNFEPQSANHMIVSLNGTIQAPVSSFTVSGSTLTFASALTSSDVIDFILVLGNVNDVGTATTVVDSAITKNKLNLISESSSAGLTVKGDGSSENGTIQLNCSQNSHGVKISSPAHSAGQSYELILPTGNVTADKVLKVASVSGSGTTGIGQLSFGDAGGTTDVLFAATMTANQTMTHEVTAKIAFNDEIYDVGTCYDHSSNYRFTVPSGKGGYYHIGYSLVIENAANTRQYINWIRPYKNGSDFHLGSGSYGGQVQYYQNNTDNPTRNIHATKSFIINLSASDYIEIYAQSATNNSSTSQAKGDYSMFWGYKLVT